MFLTVAEFSKRAGISKKKVYDEWNTTLKEYTTIKSGTKMIDEEALKLYGSVKEASAHTIEEDKEKISISEEAHKETQRIISDKEVPEKKIDNDIIIEELRSIIRAREAEIKELKEQAERTQKKIDEKDEQIKEDTKRFTETIQAQIILLGQQQEKIKLLEAPQEESKGFFKRLAEKIKGKK